MIWKTLLGAAMGVVLAGCQAHNVERTLTDPEEFRAFSNNKIAALKSTSPYLKAHMKSGAVYVFDSWNTDGKGTIITGNAALFTPLRDFVEKGNFAVGLDSVAILETNVIQNSGAAAALTIFTGITAAITISCIANPKACFGSCPTFYVSDGDSLRLQAEGFSSSISPSMEATDVDALFRARPVDGKLSVEMRNEALETHVVHHVDLLAVPRRKGCRVFADNENRFWESEKQIRPLSARGPEGDCLPALLSLDNNERFSKADESYLAAKETIELQFRTHPGRNYGLVIGCRQSLLPTYLLYQMYAYMGNDVGHWVAEIERKNFGGQSDRLEELIGGIDATVLQTDGHWNSIGGVNEHGPLATDVHLLPIGLLSDSIVTMQLRLTKGAWRIDYVALAEISEPIAPIRVHPYSVLKQDKEDPDARMKLVDSAQHLITYPGDRYILKYTLPQEHADCELFLESRGYYLEWIRKEWIEEENPLLLGEMFIAPESALKRLAPEFKRVEPQMENCFWRSRYAKP
jgi:hypothetical protein